MWSDTIADMLARIRNAYLTNKKAVDVPYSKTKKKIAQVLQDLEYLSSIKVQEEGVKKKLVIKLKYKDDEAAIRNLERVSKPGCRIYVTHDKLPVVLSGYGQAIVSTSRGIMTANEARKKGIGGELICKVW